MLTLARSTGAAGGHASNSSLQKESAAERRLTTHETEFVHDGHGSPRVIPVQRKGKSLKRFVRSWSLSRRLFACWTGNMGKLRPQNRGEIGGVEESNADK
jgi:hypothetical protein